MKTSNFKGHIAFSVFFFMIFIMIIDVSFAQTPHVTPDPYVPTPLTDQTLGTEMQKDFTTRNPNMKDLPVSWYQFSEGFYGTYTNDSVLYMSRYDKKGRYVETLKKAEWKDGVNPTLKTSFDRSQYKGQEITGYWEAVNPTKKTYYLEITDENGNPSYIWVDEKGNFSSKPNPSKRKEPKK